MISIYIILNIIAFCTSTPPQKEKESFKLSKRETSMYSREMNVPVFFSIC